MPIAKQLLKLKALRLGLFILPILGRSPFSGALASPRPMKRSTFARDLPLSSEHSSAFFTESSQILKLSLGQMLDADQRITGGTGPD